MYDEKFQKLKEALENEKFEQELMACTNVNEVKQVFSTTEIGYSEEEVQEIYDYVVKSKSNNIEINEADLENVSGGSVLGWGIAIAGCYIAGRIYGNVSKKKTWCSWS